MNLLASLNVHPKVVIDSSFENQFTSVVAINNHLKWVSKAPQHNRCCHPASQMPSDNTSIADLSKEKKLTLWFHANIFCFWKPSVYNKANLLELSSPMYLLKMAGFLEKLRFLRILLFRAIEFAHDMNTKPSVWKQLK